MWVDRPEVMFCRKGRKLSPSSPLSVSVPYFTAPLPWRTLRNGRTERNGTRDGTTNTNSKNANVTTTYSSAIFTSASAKYTAIGEYLYRIISNHCINLQLGYLNGEVFSCLTPNHTAAADKIVQRHKVSEG